MFVDLVKGAHANEDVEIHRGADYFALRQADLGTAVDEVCRKMGVSQATFFLWKQKYGGLGPSELRRLRQLEEENQKLKRLVADLSLDRAMLQEVLAKKV
jgi:putative transposase